MKYRESARGCACIAEDSDIPTESFVRPAFGGDTRFHRGGASRTGAAEQWFGHWRRSGDRLIPLRSDRAASAIQFGPLLSDKRLWDADAPFLISLQSPSEAEAA